MVFVHFWLLALNDRFADSFLPSIHWIDAFKNPPVVAFMHETMDTISLHVQG